MTNMSSSCFSSDFSMSPLAMSVSKYFDTELSCDASSAEVRSRALQETQTQGTVSYVDRNINSTKNDAKGQASYTRLFSQIFDNHNSNKTTLKK